MRSALTITRRIHALTMAAIGLAAGATRAVEAQSTELAGEGDPPFYADGFEWGDFCHWNSAVGAADTCPYDLSCVGVIDPTTAADPIVISGTLINSGSALAIVGATATARRLSDDGVLDTDTTAADGSFSLSIATGGTPDQGYLRFVANSYPDTEHYGADPLTESVSGTSLRAISSSTLDTVYLLGGAGSPPIAGAGTVLVAVQDCGGAPISGATVQLTPAPGKLGYFLGGMPSPDATSTDANGLAFGYTETAGDVTVSATKTGLTFESHALKVAATGVSLTIIHP
jgi:hypothetical protein